MIYKKKIFGEIDEVFKDDQVTKLFMSDRSLKDALSWYACVNNKMKGNPVVSFKKRELHGECLPATFTKQQLLSLSSDEMIFLAGDLLYRSSPLTCWLYWSRDKYGEYQSIFTFNIKQLTALNQLIEKSILR